MQHLFDRIQGFGRILIFCLLALTVSGCVTKQPLPFEYSAARPAQAGGSHLTLAPMKDGRTAKNTMDKVLDVPACIDTALERELNNSGLFQQVELKSDPKQSGGLLLQTSLNELAWEVPNYKSIVGTAFTVSLLTGGIGGMAYGSTETDVYGHAKVRFILSQEGSPEILLDREYSANSKARKAKLNCDTPATYREMAAKALRDVYNQFKADLDKILSK